MKRGTGFLFIALFAFITIVLMSNGVSADALSCRTASLEGSANTNIDFYGRGGTGSYSWKSLSGGTFQAGTTGAIVTIKYPDGGIKTMEVTSGTETAVCQITIKNQEIIFNYDSASDGSIGVAGDYGTLNYGMKKYTWRVPKGVTRINVKIWGGGGGGGYSHKTYNNHNGGGGGGAGGHAEADLTVKENSEYYIYVGNGGKAGTDYHPKNCGGGQTQNEWQACHNLGYSTTEGGGASAFSGDLKIDYTYVGAGGGGAGGNGCGEDGGIYGTCLYSGYAGQSGQGFGGYYGVQTVDPYGKGSGKGGMGGDSEQDTYYCKRGKGGEGGTGISFPENPLKIDKAGGNGDQGSMSGLCSNYGGSSEGGDSYSGGLGGAVQQAGSAPGGGGGGGTEESYGGNGGSGRVIITLLTSLTQSPVTPTICANDNQIMFRLFSQSNSHGAIYSEQSYPIKICYDQIFGSVYAGANPRQCSATNKVVRLSANIDAHAEGPLGTTSGYQDICYGDLACTLRDNACNADEKAVASLSGTSDAHIAIGSDSAYIKKICCKSGVGIQGTSGTNLKHRGIYFTNTGIIFDYTPSQQDSSVSWLIESSNRGEQDINENTKTFSREFATPGQRTVTIKESRPGKTAIETQIAILIVDEAVNGIFSFIEKPKHNEKVMSNELKLDFAGEESYLVQLGGSSCTRTISCLAGDCPRLTENAPAGCTNKININAAPQGFDKFRFKWSFPLTENTEVIEGDGASFSKGSIKYSSPGDYRIDLLLKYQGEGIEQLFQRRFSIWTGSCANGICALCVDDGAKLVVKDPAGSIVEEYSTSESIMGGKPACAGADGLVKTEDDCCPQGQTCRLAQGNIKAGCIPNPEIDECNDYTTPDDCNNDVNNVGNGMKHRNVLDKLRGEISCSKEYSRDSCLYRITCRCQWDSNPGAGKQPYCAIQRGDEKINEKCTSGSNDVPKCNYKSLDLSACQNGFKQIRIEARYLLPGTPPSWCQNKEVSIPCGRAVLELPLFEFWQAIISVLIVVGIYFVLRNKQDK